jgi:rhodanese-related sulfurtransferase
MFVSHAMPIHTISPVEAFRRRQTREPTQTQSTVFAPRIIDVRTPAEFGELHAAEAHLIPLDRVDPNAFASEMNGSKDAPLYFICRTGARAAKACERFAAAGFQNVFNIEGGTLAWEQAGLPVVRGERKAISLERQVRIAAGSLVLTGVALGLLVHPAFYGLAAFIGAGLIFAGVTDWCGMGMMLARMPWNQAR